MANKFTIITTSPCVKCDATKRRMTKWGIPFDVVAKEDAADIVEEARAEGATSFPIVVTPGGSFWSDYRIDKIDAWKTHVWPKEEEQDD